MQRRHVLLALSPLGLALAAGCSKKESATDAAPASPAPAAAPAAPAAPAQPKSMSAAEAQKAYEAAASGSGFNAGSVVAANTVFVFFDPQCPHCASLWTQSQPLLGKLKMVWLPVGFVRKSSIPQGALLLSAKDPAALMTEHEALLSADKGGIPVPPQVDEAQIAKVKANTDLLGKLGADSVPFIVYKNAKTGVFGSHAGSLTTEQLAEAAGV